MWNDADPHLIDKGKVEQVRLRSFSTNVHKMEVRLRLLPDVAAAFNTTDRTYTPVHQAMVAYRVGE